MDMTVTLGFGPAGPEHAQEMGRAAAAARRHTIDTARGVAADAAFLRLFAYWQNSALSAHSGAKTAGNL
jgi:hypothetical protein